MAIRHVHDEQFVGRFADPVAASRVPAKHELSNAQRCAHATTSRAIFSIFLRSIQSVQYSYERTGTAQIDLQSAAVLVLDCMREQWCRCRRSARNGNPAQEARASNTARFLSNYARCASLGCRGHLHPRTPRPRVCDPTVSMRLRLCQQCGTCHLLVSSDSVIRASQST